jgi:tRNA(fMet)-specific endonuclease VapC
LIYLLDTNAISDLIVEHSGIVRQVEVHRINRDVMAVCQPVYYELLRGLIRTKATKKLSILRNRLLPQFDWLPLQDEDWIQAAQFWSDAIQVGKQLSDMDFLIAAIAHRLDAVIVSSDTDFDALPVKRDNWRDFPQV